MTDSMTLAFDFEAIEALADPQAVFEDACQWSSYIGVVSDKPGYEVVNYLRDQGVYEEDFYPRADVGGTLVHLRRQLETDRHVFVARGGEATSLASDIGWEYLPLVEAAEKAGWSLASDAIDRRPRQSPE